MIKIVAIDDDVEAILSIENFCRNSKDLVLEKTFDNPKDGLKYLNKFPIDVVLLNADRSYLKGTELSKQIKQDTIVVHVISANANGQENSKSVYSIKKPLTETTLSKLMKKVLLHLETEKENNNKDDDGHFFVRADYNLIKVNINDIVYVEALDDYVKLHLFNQKSLIVRFTMKTMQEKLPEKKFMRIHRSYIVAKNKVERINKKIVKIDGKELPLGLKYEEQVAKQMLPFSN